MYEYFNDKNTFVFNKCPVVADQVNIAAFFND